MMRTTLHKYLFLIFILSLSACSLMVNKSKSKDHKENETDMPDMMMKWEYERVKNPVTGEVPTQNLVTVYEKYISEQTDLQAPVAGIEWIERGPNNVGGRTRAIIFDRNDVTNKTVFAASVGGGLFKCTDIDAATPTWNKINDFFSNIAINCLVQNQNHPDTMFFGTGEGFGNADALRGLGVWRSADGGANWTQLASVMEGSLPTYINRLAINSQGTIYAATSNGLYTSTNGGTSWITVLRTIGTNPTTASNIGHDVKIAANNDVYYTCSTQVWKYTFSSSSWSNVTPSGSFARIEVACSPSDANFVYLLCQSRSSSAVTGFFSTNNGGSTWRSRSVPLIYDQAATAATELSRNQAWYDLSLAVDPFTPTTVYAGAIDYIKSTDTGATYKQISAWSLYAMPGGAKLGTSQVVHSDHHILVFKPGSNSFALLGSDGGIYRSTNMNNVWTSVPSYTAINTNYNVTQLYACAAANVAGSNNFLGGAQDNGSFKFNSTGMNSVTMVSGGDGCYCHIDQDNSNNQLTSYVYNNYYVSTDGTNFSALSGATNNGDFVNPSDLDGTNNILYSKSGGVGIIARWSNVFASVSRTNLTITGVAGISHIKVSPNDPTKVYLGTTAGNIYRVNSANSSSSPITPTLLTSTAFGGRISCIDIRKCSAGTDDTILVTMSSYGLGNSVLYTLNGTSATPTWTDIDDNSTLPDIPVNSGMFAPINGSKEVMLGTDMGIYSCDNIFASTPTWGQSNTGLANVRIDMLKIRSADSLIAAATHGRGLYTTDKYISAQANFTANKTLAYISSNIQFTDLSIKSTSWAWDFDNNGSVDATDKNPIWAYGTPGIKTVTLTINNGTKAITKTSYIKILPNKSVPYTTNNGGDFESNADDFGAMLLNGINWERGNSSVNGKNGTKSGSNAWVTGLSASAYTVNNETYLYTPNFNLKNASNDSIKFYIKNVFEIGYDGMRVEYSLDKGNTWTPLSTSTASNWYDYANTSNNTSFAQNQAFFNVTNSSFTPKKYSLAALNGNVNVAFRFAFKSDNLTNAAGIAIDNFEIVSSVVTKENQNIETALTSKTEYLGPNDTVDFFSPNGKILATIINQTNHDYGLTTVSIDNAGLGAVNYGPNTAANKKIAQKTFTITPTVNNVNGSYTIKFYYTNAEILGWKSITGGSFNNINILKCPSNIASGTLQNGIYGTAVSKQLYSETDSSVTASFNTGFSGFGIGENIIVLPIDLLSFKVAAEGVNAKLQWATASEKNNKLFEIERSIHGQDFEKIGEVNGGGNTYSLCQYEYTDLKVLIDNRNIYYRLKQIDVDGTYKYSGIEQIQSHIENNIQVSIYPQPIKQFLNVKTNLNEGFSYTIYSFDGKAMLTGVSSTSNTAIDLSKLANGNFVLSIMDREEHIQKLKFVKVE